MDYVVTYLDCRGATVTLVCCADDPAAALELALDDGPEPADATSFTVRPALATDGELAELVDVAHAVGEAYRMGLGLAGSHDDPLESCDDE